MLVIDFLTPFPLRVSEPLFEIVATMILLRWTFIMSLACTIHGIIGVDNGRAYQYAENKRFWLHDGHLPMPDNDLSVHAMTFGGDPVPLPKTHLIPLRARSSSHRSIHWRTVVHGFVNWGSKMRGLFIIFFPIPTTIVMLPTLCTHVCYYNSVPSFKFLLFRGVLLCYLWFISYQPLNTLEDELLSHFVQDHRLKVFYHPGRHQHGLSHSATHSLSTTAHQYFHPLVPSILWLAGSYFSTSTRGKVVTSPILQRPTLQPVGFLSVWHRFCSASETKLQQFPTRICCSWCHPINSWYKHSPSQCFPHLYWSRPLWRWGPDVIFWHLGAS